MKEGRGGGWERVKQGGRKRRSEGCVRKMERESKKGEEKM